MNGEQSVIDWILVEKEIFSQKQMKICEMKLSGAFQTVILEKFKLASLSNITTAACATISGIRWGPQIEIGGRHLFFSQLDTLLFKKEIKRRYLSFQYHLFKI